MFDYGQKSEREISFVHGKIVAIAQAILDQQIGVIAGSRILTRLAFELSIDMEENFLIFKGIDSETDHLPVDWERRNWGDEALKRKDAEIAKYEDSARDEVFTACKKIIEQFEAPYRKRA